MVVFWLKEGGVVSQGGLEIFGLDTRVLQPQSELCAYRKFGTRDLLVRNKPWTIDKISFCNCPSARLPSGRMSFVKWGAKAI